MGKNIARVERTTAPRVLCVVAYTPDDRSEDDGSYMTTAKEWSVETWVHRNGKWHRSKAACYSGASAELAWLAVVSSARGRGRSYVVCNGAVDTLTLLGFWDKADRMSISMRVALTEYEDEEGRKRKRRPHPLILSASPEVIGFSAGLREYRAVGYRNHLPMSLADCAAMAEVPLPDGDGNDRRPTGAERWPATLAADVMARCYMRLIDRWRVSDSGRWADTIGIAAYNRWRSTIGDDKLLEHDSEGAHALECAACFGGRAETYFFGFAGRRWQEVLMSDDDGGETWPPVSEPIHRVDIRSMYANLLSSREFPCRLQHQIRVRSVQHLRDLAESGGVIARVRVRLESPSIPFDAGEKGIVYPAGEWIAVLCGDELLDACRRGEVVSVSACWLYTMRPIFKEFADQLLAERMSCIEAGDKVGGMWCKLLANSLAGKLASQRRGWIAVPEKPCRQQWGEWREIATGLDTPVRCRGIAGVRQEYHESGEKRKGLTACFAWLTSYGRSFLNRLMLIAGSHAVLACDTDGFLVTDTGLSRLREVPGLMGTAPGELRYEGEVSSWLACTPKHYLADGKWTLAGVRGDAGPVTGRKCKAWAAASPIRRGAKPDGRGIQTVCYTFRIDRIPLSGTPGVDGWLIPPRVVDGQLTQPRDAKAEDYPD